MRIQTYIKEQKLSQLAIYNNMSNIEDKSNLVHENNTTNS